MFKRLLFTGLLFGALLVTVNCNQKKSSAKTDTKEVVDNTKSDKKEGKAKKELNNETKKEGRKIANLVEMRVKQLKKKYELNDAQTTQARIILQSACKEMDVELNSVLKTKEEQTEFLNKLNSKTKVALQEMYKK